MVECYTLNKSIKTAFVALLKKAAVLARFLSSLNLFSLLKKILKDKSDEISDPPGGPM